FAQQQIGEDLLAGFDYDAQPLSRTRCQSSISAAPRVGDFSRRLSFLTSPCTDRTVRPVRLIPPGTLTRIHHVSRTQHLERALIRRAVVALTERRWALPQLGTGRLVRSESQPFEVFQQRRLVFRTAALTIVVFQSQQHFSAGCACHAPDI